MDLSRFLGAALAVALVSAARSASASVAIVVEGKGAKAAAAAVESALVGNETVVPATAIVAALPHAPLGPALADAKKQSAILSSVRSAAVAAHVDDVIVLISEKKGGVRAYLIAPTGVPFEDLAPAKEAPSALAERLREELIRLRPPAPAAPPTPSTEVPRASARDAPEGATDARSARSPLEIELSGGVGGRRFRYSDPLSAGLRRYDLPAAPMAGVNIGFYPLAFSRPPVVDVGLVGGYARAFGFRSETAVAQGRDANSAASGSSVSNQWSRFYVGARARVAASRSFLLGMNADYSGETFTFEGALAAESPSVAYRSLRVGLDGRFVFGKVALEAYAAYDAVLSGGPVADRFPHARIGGIDASGGPTFALDDHWSVRLKIDYRRFFYAMNPVPGDSHVAGGALEEIYGVRGGLAYAY